nr:acylphosphatase [Desulfobacterales bacterium]
MNMVRAHAIIEGRVQGVFFRFETREVAARHNVTGWVKNRRDGSVEAVFEGPRKDVDNVIEWCHVGPPSARVTRVTVHWEPYTGEFNKFDILY